MRQNNERLLDIFTFSYYWPRGSIAIMFQTSGNELSPGIHELQVCTLSTFRRCRFSNGSDFSSFSNISPLSLKYLYFKLPPLFKYLSTLSTPWGMLLFKRGCPQGNTTLSTPHRWLPLMQSTENIKHYIWKFLYEEKSVFRQNIGILLNTRSILFEINFRK